MNTQKLLTLLNIQRNGGMKIVEEILRPIDNPNISKTRNVSRVQLRKQNTISLI